MFVTDKGFIRHEFVTNLCKMVKRVSISLDKEQALLLRNLKCFGTKEAEKVKNLMMAYLSEKGYLKEFNKRLKR